LDKLLKSLYIYLGLSRDT